MSRLRASVVTSFFSVALLLALPAVTSAQATAARTLAAPAPTAALLVNGIVSPASQRTQRGLVATRSRRTRLVLGGTVVGAIAGGYLGYRLVKPDLCVQSPSYSCSNDRQNTLKGGVLGAAIGGIAGLFLSRL